MNHNPGLGMYLYPAPAMQSSTMAGVATLGVCNYSVFPAGCPNNYRCIEGQCVDAAAYDAEREKRRDAGRRTPRLELGVGIGISSVIRNGYPKQQMEVDAITFSLGTRMDFASSLGFRAEASTGFGIGSNTDTGEGVTLQSYSYNETMAYGALLVGPAGSFYFGPSLAVGGRKYLAGSQGDSMDFMWGGGGTAGFLLGREHHSSLSLDVIGGQIDDLTGRVPYVRAVLAYRFGVATL